MISGEGYRGGLTQQEANDGISMLTLSWTNRPPGPFQAVIFYNASGLTPGVSATLQLFPTGDFAPGPPDINGNLGGNITISNDGDDIHFSGYTFADGFYQQDIRAVLSYTPALHPGFSGISFTIQVSGYDPDDPTEFTENLGLDPPSDLTASEPVYNEDTGQWDMTFTWTNGEPTMNTMLLAENSTTYVEGSVPAGVTEFVEHFTNELPPVENWSFTAKHYSYGAPNQITGPSNVETVSFVTGPEPDIDYTGDVLITLGGSSTIVLIGDPSGIYTVVTGKRHDTLYNRAGATVEELDVPIPEPFAKTAYLGD